MTIFNTNQPRLKSIPRYVSRQQPSGNQIPLVVGLFTPNMTTELYDYVQLYYHGGGVYTAVTYVLDHKRGLRVTNGKVVALLLDHAPNTKKVKTLEIYENPFDKSPVCTNLRIKTIGTFVMNDDSELRSQLVEDGYSSIQYAGKSVQLIDARHSKEPHELGQWYSPTAQFIEFHNEPNGDFVNTMATTFNHETNGRLNPSKEQIVKRMMEAHLPNLQKQLYFEFLSPCINA